MRKLQGGSILPYFSGFSPLQRRGLKGKPVAWIQASSVGETMVAATFLPEFRKEFPEYSVVFTCTTQTGKETADRVLPGLADLIGFFPFDHPWVVKRFIRQLNPQALLLIETELWPNVLWQAKKNGAKICLINGRLGERSYLRLEKTGLSFLYRPLMKLVDLFCIQSQTDKERFLTLGAAPERLVVTGNIKFDQQTTKRTPAEIGEFAKPLNLEKERPILAAGSTHSGEDEVILAAFAGIKEELPDAFLILAPRHLERVGNIERLLSAASFKWVKRSRILEGEVPQEETAVLLLDTYGELGMAYALSTVSFIGGSLVPVGGHNVLEAALLSRVVLYGPYMHNFRDSKELLERVGAGFTVHSAQEIREIFLRLQADEERLAELGGKARRAVLSNKGATKQTIESLKKLLASAW